MSPADQARFEKHAAITKQMLARGKELIASGNAIDQQVGLKLLLAVERRSGKQLRMLLKTARPELAQYLAGQLEHE